MTTTAIAGPRGYEPEQVWLPASEQLLEWDEGFHDLMLGDQLRMNAFHEAIAAVVRPGFTVLDLGTGTGVLARWALEAGAARVYGLELNASLLQDAADQMAAAGYGARFLPVFGVSFDVDLPERVDVVISETLGNLVDNENCVEILADARQRFLATNGVLVPSQAASYLVPVMARRAHAQIRRGQPCGSSGPAAFAEQLRRRGARNGFDLYYDTIIPIDTYLSSPQCARRYILDGSEEATYEERLSYAVHTDGIFTGFKGYFLATLAETVTLDISGDDIAHGTTSDSWKHCYLPIEEPVRVSRGDRIGLTFSRYVPPSGQGPRSFQQHYRWDGDIVSPPHNRVKGTFSQTSTSAARDRA